MRAMTMMMMMMMMMMMTSVGHELTQMSLNSRINSLAMIYEFELTHHKECELWVWFNSKFMWVELYQFWNQLTRTTKVENNWCWLPDWVGYRRVLYCSLWQQLLTHSNDRTTAFMIWFFLSWSSYVIRLPSFRKPIWCTVWSTGFSSVEWTVLQATW